MNASAILHVTSPFGGGVDRYIRDIAHGVDRPQFIWHAGDHANVIEDLRSGRYYPLSGEAVTERAEDLAQWLRSLRIGLVHLHQLTRAPRQHADWVCTTLGVPRIATLHDVLFLSPDAFDAGERLAADPAWLAETSRSLRAAQAVLAPSRWLALLASERVAGLDVTIVPNGSETGTKARSVAPRPEFTLHPAGHVVALIGALGPHKGSDLVDEIAARLAGTDICIVVVGYLERQFLPGWRVPGRLFVHGAYAQGDATGLLRGYGASLVLMPNETPESFSYTLSDAWMAGLPVLAAPRGALAERIGACGGGWLLPEHFDAEAVAGQIRALAGGTREAERARVQSELAQPDPERIPSLAAMTNSLDALYKRFGIDPAAPEAAGDDATQALLARNLDATLFRKELVRASDELAQTLAALADAQARAEAFESESRVWIAKLEADIDTLQAELRESTSQREQLEAGRRSLEEEQSRIGGELARLGAEIALLRQHREAFDLLPMVIRRLLLKRVLDARR